MANELVEETRTLLEKRFEAASAGDYFGVLGLENSASTKQVQDNCFKLAKLLPRIRSHRTASSMRTTAKRRCRSSSSPPKPRTYWQTRPAPKVRQRRTSARPGVFGRRPKQKRVKSQKRSQDRLPQSAIMLNKRAYQDAERFLMEAAKAEPDNPKHWQKLGWAIFQNIEERKKIGAWKRPSAAGQGSQL